MPRVFSLLLLFVGLLSLELCFQPGQAHAASKDQNIPLWQSILDFEDKHAFEIYGPPMPENAAKAVQETKLYEDMVKYFDDTAEDEPDFTFVVEAYSVGVSAFRPEVIRPQGEAQPENADNPFGEDDPLPESVKSTSAYVEEVRPTYLPGEPLKMHGLNEVKLGDDHLGSLFAESDRLKAEANGTAVPAAPKPEETPAPGQPEQSKPKSIMDQMRAGQIDTPKKKGPLPGSDEETLANLKKAVKELGLESQLNFNSKQEMGNVPTVTPPSMSAPAAAKPAAATPAPGTSPLPTGPDKKAAAPATPTSAPPAQPDKKAAAPAPAKKPLSAAAIAKIKAKVKAKTKKAEPKKKAVKKKVAKPVMPKPRNEIDYEQELPAHELDQQTAAPQPEEEDNSSEDAPEVLYPKKKY